MRQQIIQQSETLVLTSYGNGWAYKLYNSASDRSIWLQDDDATIFRKELASFEKHNPTRCALAYLWGAYECVSQPDTPAA